MTTVHYLKHISKYFKYLRHSIQICILSLSSTSPSPYTIYGTICIPTQNQTVQPTNYKCGILPGRTSPFPSCFPLPVPHPPPPPCHIGSSFCLSKTHQSHPSTTPSLPPYSIICFINVTGVLKRTISERSVNVLSSYHPEMNPG